MNSPLPECRVWEPQYKRLSPVHFLNWLSETELEVDYDANLNEPKMVNGETIILEWYTGRKDMDGMKVYQGDIIALFGSPSIGGVVVWRNDRWDIEFFGNVAAIRKEKFLGSLPGNLEDCQQKIGNIHQNPELLKVAQ